MQIGKVVKFVDYNQVSSKSVGLNLSPGVDVMITILTIAFTLLQKSISNFLEQQRHNFLGRLKVDSKSPIF
jgi:hypothetical protein